MHVRPHDLIEVLERLRRSKAYKPIAARLQMVILAKQRFTAPQIAQAVGLSRRPVQQWIGRYNLEGVGGLYDRPRSGQPVKLSSQQQQAFKQRILAGPTEADGVCTLRGRDAQRILKQEFGVHYSLNGIYDLLHRLNMSCLKPRPRHRKNDPQAMTQWLESAPLLSSKSSKNTVKSRSKCGSRTKRGSASKGR